MPRLFGDNSTVQAGRATARKGATQFHSLLMVLVFLRVTTLVMRLNYLGRSKPLSTEKTALDVQDSISLISVQDGADVRMTRKLDTSYNLWALSGQQCMVCRGVCSRSSRAVAALNVTLQELPSRKAFFTVLAFGQSVHGVPKLSEVGVSRLANLRMLFDNVSLQRSAGLVSYPTMRAYMRVTFMCMNWDQTGRACRLQAGIHMFPPLTQWRADKGVLR